MAAATATATAAVAAWAGLTVALHVVFVLLGAPFLESVLETLATAALVAAATAVPAVYTLGAWDLDRWHRVFCGVVWETKAERAIAVYVYTIAASLWASAAVVPLDWDVWYQRWPIPCLAAAAFSTPLAAGLAAASHMLAPTTTFDRAAKHA